MLAQSPLDLSALSDETLPMVRAGMLEQIGRAARQELERLLERRVYLRLWVKVRKDWRNDQQILRQLGL